MNCALSLIPESVRLVNGISLCSGRVEVKSDQSWVSVCEGDFDQQDAQVACRELGCGVPLVLQGALYGEGKAPMWTKKLQCEGSESVLQDCGISHSTRNACSPDKAVGLTCSGKRLAIVEVWIIIIIIHIKTLKSLRQTYNCFGAWLNPLLLPQVTH